jgi:S-disulfanyl-L-cysteine oxidoreductase SoxD
MKIQHGALILFAASLWAQSPKYGVGRAPTADEIKAWDITVFPDGRGLPEGSGTAAEGKDVYERRCQRCHGSEGKGGDEPPLVGGQGTIATPKPLKTVGSYWPYATTLFDYIRRAMPFKDPGILTANQTYAVAAYILQLNGLIGVNDAMNAKTLPQVKMPNRDGFIPDPRPDTGRRK